jgi:integrase
MRTGDLINSSHLGRCIITGMQVLDENSEVFYNFINTLHSDSTKESYTFCLEKFLNHYGIDLLSFLTLPQHDITNLIIKYLVNKKVSKQYKNLITATLKHACEINDILLNWKKIKKFVNSAEKTGNETNGRDRGYTHEEIQRILDFSSQRIKTMFLIVASTGIRVGALRSLKVGDLEKIDNVYKIIVYAGDKEEYITFTTPECTKEIDSYLDFRSRHNENITNDSFLLVQKYNINLKSVKLKGKQFKGRGINSVLEESIRNCGLRQVNHDNYFKRQAVPFLHGFRKFFTKQLVDSKLNPEIREMLLGHKIGLASAYYKPTQEDMYNEYLKAVNLLTIKEENRLKLKLERVQIEKSKLDELKADFDAFKQEVLKQRNARYTLH